MGIIGIRDAATAWIKAAISVCLTALCVVAALVTYERGFVQAAPYAMLAAALAVFDWRMLRAMSGATPDARRTYGDALFFVPLSGIAAATLIASIAAGSVGIPTILVAVLCVVTGLFARSALRHLRDGTNRPDRGWAVTRSRRDIRAALDMLRESRRR